MEQRKSPMADNGKRPVSISGKRNRYLGSGGSGGTANVTSSILILQVPRAKCTSKVTRAWLDHWMQQINILKGRKVADNTDFRKRIRAKKYGNDDLFRLCDPIRRVKLSHHILCDPIRQVKLSHHILCAHLYHVEIGELLSITDPGASSWPVMETHVQLLQRDAHYKSCYNGGGTQADWVSIALFFESAFEKPMHGGICHVERDRIFGVSKKPVAFQEEAEALDREWRRLWGHSTVDSASPLSYWSLGTRNAGGVAILLTPDMAQLAQPWPGRRGKLRAAAVPFEIPAKVVFVHPVHNFSIVQYDPKTPPSHSDRRFELRPKSLARPAGDTLTSRTKSPALDTLTDMCQLVDALDLVPHPDDALEWEPSTHFTYWAGSAASRIDRFYVSHTWGDRVQYLEAISLRQLRITSKSPCISCLGNEAGTVFPVKLRTLYVLQTRTAPSPNSSSASQTVALLSYPRY
ncbi:unnamed protein product [Peronospora belbahrii]|uniref:Uncharacterized protein n=1 Tax=Peronospora belbahrii TaxID=622444 RepID=A0ABN8CSZ2_9STRA|nr:unnamed protein product [Peronospora belbahrii]